MAVTIHQLLLKWGADANKYCFDVVNPDDYLGGTTTYMMEVSRNPSGTLLYRSPTNPDNRSWRGIILARFTDTRDPVTYGTVVYTHGTYANLKAAMESSDLKAMSFEDSYFWDAECTTPFDPRLPLDPMGNYRTVAVELVQKHPTEYMTLRATTTAPATATKIHWLTAVGGSLTIDWGDGSTDTTTEGLAEAHFNHTYALAGSYKITIGPVRCISGIGLEMANLSGFDSTQLANAPMTRHFELATPLGSTVPNVVRSANMVNWRPTWWRVSDLSAADTVVIDTADMAAWNPTEKWSLNSLTAGTFTVNSTHMVTWRPVLFYLFTLPAGTYSIDMTDMSNWTTTTFWHLYDMPGNIVSFIPADVAGWHMINNFKLEDGFTEAYTNALLWGLYQASVGRTGGAGGRDAIFIAGDNAAPSGTYQACAACPVAMGTPGKEIAYELKNDTCALGITTWFTVTYT